jgi:hypothetical protein
MMKKPTRPMRTENNPSYIYIDRRGCKRLKKKKKTYQDEDPGPS